MMTAFFRSLHRASTVSQALFTVYYAYMVEYRAELMFWVLSGTFPLIFMGIWAQAAQGGQFALDSITFVRYFLVVFLVRQLTVVWVIWEFEREVNEGKLSPFLLQPLDPVWRHFFRHVSERFARLPFILGLIALFFLLYPAALWIPTPRSLILGFLAILAAFCLRFIIQYTFSLFAFWIERAYAIEEFWFLMFTFLSGMIAPLEVFPEAVRTLVLWTPFPYLIYFPANLLIGQASNVMQGFGAIALWGLIFLGINRWLWRRGLRQYSGMGA
jgi:ABC-2 type transport system permease protein